MYVTALYDLPPCRAWLITQADFDVLNALTLLDNNLFLNEQKFGQGDGFLNCKPRPGTKWAELI